MSKHDKSKTRKEDLDLNLYDFTGFICFCCNSPRKFLFNIIFKKWYGLITEGRKRKQTLTNVSIKKTSFLRHQSMVIKPKQFLIFIGDSGGPDTRSTLP